MHSSNMYVGHTCHQLLIWMNFYSLKIYLSLSIRKKNEETEIEREREKKAENSNKQIDGTYYIHIH